MFIGAHTSIAGGFSKCIDRAIELGSNCLMTFTSSPRSLKNKPIPDSELLRYLDRKATSSLGPHFFHGPYLINLAAENPNHLQSSIESLIYYQALSSRINGKGTIFHLGSHKGRGFKSVKNQVVSSLNQVLEQTPSGVNLYLENSAGQGGTLGETFSELKELLSELDQPEKVSFCLDTQHAFASGIPIEFQLQSFSSEIGLNKLGVIHLNDSKTDLGSHLDRHENLGQGKIGILKLHKFINDGRISQIPLILEVPGSGFGPRKEDINQVKSLFD